MRISCEGIKTNIKDAKIVYNVKKKELKLSKKNKLGQTLDVVLTRSELDRMVTLLIAMPRK